MSWVQRPVRRGESRGGYWHCTGTHSHGARSLQQGVTSVSTIISSNRKMDRIHTKLLISGRSLYVTTHVFKHEILCLWYLKILSTSQFLSHPNFI